MPTYQYACTVCGHRFDAVQSFSDASLTECPQCAGLLRKVFSSVGIVFKGSGFYRTDSRNGGGSTVAAAETSSSSTPSSEGSKSNGSSTESGSKTSTSTGSGSSSSGSANSSSPAAAAS